MWLNFIGDEGQERVRAAFGAEKYCRLARVKQEFDPENTFHGNQNTGPPRPEARTACAGKSRGPAAPAVRRLVSNMTNRQWETHQHGQSG